MKSVFSTIVIFIGLYIIVCSGIMDFLAQNYVFYIALGSVIIALLAAVAFIGTPFSKPFIKIKRRGDDHDQNAGIS